MTWNYRVMRRRVPPGPLGLSDAGFSFAVHEVYYGPDGEPNAWSAEPTFPLGETLQELEEANARYLSAFKKNVLAIERNDTELWELRGVDAEPVLVYRQGATDGGVPDSDKVSRKPEEHRDGPDRHSGEGNQGDTGKR